MLAHVSYIHTETAFALIHKKGSCLEYSLDCPVSFVKVSKSHKVSEKSVEIAEDMKELVHHLDIACFLCECDILSHEIEQGSLLILSEERLDSIQPQSLY